MNEKTQFSVDPEGRWVYKVGGIAAFILAIGYLLTFPVYAWVGDAPPTSVEAQVVYFGEHAAGWWTILFLMVITDILLIPVFTALYLALKETNKYLMLLAVACAGLFVTLDLAVTWTAFSALLIAGGHYAAATSEVMKSVAISAAGYPSAVLASPLSGVYGIVMPALGVLLTGIVMLKGTFNKTTAILAILMGITGIIFMGKYAWEALDFIRIVNALLAMIWYFFISFGLVRLGKNVK